MKIKVKLHPNSSQEKIQEVSKDSYEIWIKEKPIDNKANLVLINFLKRYFNASEIKITAGYTRRNKIVEIS